MQNKDSTVQMEDFEAMNGAPAPSMDLLGMLKGVLSRWKLVAVITLAVLVATYGIVKLVVPSRYKSTVEILVFDPQRQIDATVQKPISPFVDAVGNDFETWTGMCGKQGQCVPVSSGQPTVLVREMTVGGTAA